MRGIFGKIIIFCIFGVLLALPASPAFAGAVAMGLRLADKDDYTRFVLDIEGIKEHKVFTLANPDRLVIDIEDSKWSVSSGDIAQAKSRLIKTIRHGRPVSGTMRIVLDLHKPVTTKNIFVLPKTELHPTPRLVVDFAITDFKGAAFPKKVRHPALPKKTEEKADDEEILRQKASARPKATPHQPPVERPVNIIPDNLTPVKRQKSQKKTSTAPRYKPVVVIDPGHGGIDPGAIGRSKVKEKIITFQYAVDLKNALEKEGNYRVTLTRKGDYFVNLRDRVKKARAARGDVFISLHADSHPDPKTRGLSVYTLSEKASDKEAAALARRQDKDNLIEGVDLSGESSEIQKLLIDLVQRDTKNTSSEFAEMMVKELGKEARLLKNTHRFAGFAVLTSTDVPSVLVELGYLSNLREEKLLQTPEYRKKLVEAISTAIRKYFKKIGKG